VREKPTASYARSDWVRIRTMNAGVLVKSMIGFLIVLCGCTEDPGTSVVSNPSVSAKQERPATKHGSIALEGKEEPFTSFLFKSEAAPLPVAFTTYVPSDMIVEHLQSEVGGAVRFVANFENRRQPDAYLEVLFYFDGTDESKARSLTAKSGKSAGSREFAWSLAEYNTSYKTAANVRIFGVTALGSHDGRYFRITLHYPEEFGDGFGPRVRSILDEWRWKDTNKGL